MEVMGVNIIFSVVFGVICALLADSRGRSAVGWFFIGFFFSCLAIIILLILPDLKVEQAKHDRLARENRRLRERLKKDRLVTDRRFRESEKRLGLHDQALGMDTSNRIEGPARKEALPRSSPPTTEVRNSAVGSDPFEGTFWYYVDEGEQAGPVEFNELKRLWRKRAIQANTLVWHETMKDWAPIEDVPEMKERLNG